MVSPILHMKGISKVFPGVTALEDVDFTLNPGEVHALMGENGAGKSTLMKILSGVYEQTSGEISILGEKVTFKNPSDAQEKGISIIHQEFNLFPNLSAAENIFIDRKEVTGKFGKIKWPLLYQRANELVQSIGADIDVKEEVQNLSVQNMQVIEIAKALSYNARVLIMDEPSAALPENEVQKMFDVVNQLKKNGVAIVYVSHRMKEIFEIADKVTVLRDGKKIGTKSIKETNENELISMMIGKEVGDLYPKRRKPISEEIVLDVQNLKLDAKSNLSFTLKKGEILGLFGLKGSGTHTLAERLFGLKKGSGNLRMYGKEINIQSPKQAMDHKIGFVPPDRHRQGLVKELTVSANVSMSVLNSFRKRMVINKVEEVTLSETYIKKLRIKTPSSNQIVEYLSGGNQQKIVLAKWLAMNPEVLIMEEPTRGVDVGAKAEIYQLMNEMAEEGLSILLISSEMTEVIGVCDRILVMNKGTITKSFKKGEVDQQKLLKEASNSGGVSNEKNII
jgi:ABC-type sugar transport system ATPase subunit